MVWTGKKCIQESCHPIGKDIDSGARIVYIGEDVAWLAVASIREGFGAPSSSASMLALYSLDLVIFGRPTQRECN